MASTVPAKTQPLHNFSLPHLKWKNNHPRGRSASSFSSPHHQSRSRSQSPSHSQSPMREQPRQSPLRGAGGDAVPERDGLVKSKGTVEYRRYPRNSLRNGVYTSDHDRVLEKSGKKSSYEPDQMDSISNKKSNIGTTTTTNNSDNSNKESRSRFLIKIPAGAASQKSSSKGGEEKKGEEAADGEEEEPMGKTWNLRPRKPIRKSLNGNGGGALKGGNGSAVQENRAQSEQVNSNGGNRNRVVGGEASGPLEKKEKRMRFSIPLSREEIEEDVFAFTGLKPARKPKKRAKIVQKQLDTLFPGLWLASITPDSYKVSENPMKG